MLRKFRLISLILIAVMMCQLLQVSAFEDTYNHEVVTSDEDVKNLTEDFVMLKELGMTAPEQKFLNNDDIMTRADYAYISARLLGYEPGSVLNVNTFLDVDKNAYYAGAIAFLLDRNIISGMNKYQFFPDDAITYDAAMSISVKILGYMGISNKKYGQYPYNIRLMAQELDLNSGVSCSGDEKMSVANGFKTLKNVALAPVLSAHSYTGDMITYIQSDSETLLYTYHKIVQKKGIMNDNGITALNGSTNMGLGRAAIGDIELFVKDNYNCTGLLGRNVEFYYDEKSETILYAREDEPRNKILEINADDLDVDNSKFSLRHIPYFDEKGTNRSASLSVSARMIYNGAAYPTFLANELKIDAGKIILIDNNGDGIYDVVDVWEYQDFVVMSFADDNAALIGETIELDEYLSAKIYDKNGDIIDADSVISGAVATVFKSHNKVNVDIYVSTTKVEGTIDAIGEKNGRDEYYLNENSYMLSNVIAGGNSVPILLNRNYIFSLNAYNEIVKVEMEYGDDWQVAYCVGLAKDSSSSVSDDVMAKLIMSDGSEFCAYLAKKVSVNNAHSVKAKSLLTDSRFFVVGGIDDGVPLRQPIRIKLNSKGDIVSIETASNSVLSGYKYDVEKFSKDACLVSGNFRGTTQRTIGTYTIAEKAVVFFDPYLENYTSQLVRRGNSAAYSDANTNMAVADMIATPGDNYETEGVKGFSVSGLGNEQMMCGVHLYELDEALTASVVVYNARTINASAYNQEMIIVDSCYFTRDEDGEMVKGISGLSYGTRVDYVELNEGVLPADTKSGDIFCFVLSEGKLHTVQRIARLSETVLPSTTSPIGHSIENGKWVNILGYLYSKSLNSVVVYAPTATNGTVCGLIGNAITPATKVTVYYKDTKELKKGTLSDVYTDIAPDKTGIPAFDPSFPDSNGTSVFIYRRYDCAREIVVVR